MRFFIQYAWERPDFFFPWMLLVIFSICLHEFMHAYTALKLGDDTAARTGHLTLNPFKQMGIFSLIMLAMIGICWGAVPVNRNNFQKKYASALVSAVGPFTNFALFVFFSLITAGLLRIFYNCGIDGEKVEFVCNMFYYGAVMNVMLFAFNILPIPGFDGFGIIESLVSKEFIQSEFFKGTSIVGVILAFYFSDRIFAAVNDFTLAVIEILAGA